MAQQRNEQSESGGGGGRQGSREGLARRGSPFGEMGLWGESPFRRALAEMDWMFDQLQRSFFGAPWGRGERMLARTPHIEMEETDEAMIVRVEIPGVDPKDLNVDFRDGVLTVRGESRREEGDQERRRVRPQLRVVLPAGRASARRRRGPGASHVSQRRAVDPLSPDGAGAACQAHPDHDRRPRGDGRRPRGSAARQGRLKPLQPAWGPGRASGRALTHPVEDPRPELPVGARTDEHADVLQRHARVAVIVDHAGLRRGGVEEGQHGCGGDDTASRIEHGEDGRAHPIETGRAAGDPQRASHEAVLPIQALDDVAQEAPAHRQLVQRPALHAPVQQPALRIRSARDAIQPALPQERVGRGRKRARRPPVSASRAVMASSRRRSA